MDFIFAPRSLIWRRVLWTRLAAVCATPDPDIHRPQVLALLRQALADGQLEIRRRFAMSGHGTTVVRETCYLMDQIIRLIYDYTSHFVLADTPHPNLSLVAVGGYGRGELSPKSDLDLLFLIPGKSSAGHGLMVEKILYFLWDMGLKVGHSVRSQEECLTEARKDMTIRTALLDMRGLWGAQGPFLRLKAAFQRRIVAQSGPAFAEAKLAERDARHNQMGDSRYVLEPNVKEGKGGLRDLHTLHWLAKYLYGVDGFEGLVERGLCNPATALRFAKAQDFLWTVRCHMHYLAGRQEDRLTFDLQTDVARRMGYMDRGPNRSVERFMRHFFLIAKDVGDLTRLICALAEEQQKRRPTLGLSRLLHLVRWTKRSGFAMDGQRLTIGSPQQFMKTPMDMLRLFWVAQQQRLDIHPTALAAIHRSLGRVRGLRGDPDANRLFLDILTTGHDPASTLRRMNEAGVLGRFIPAFARVVGRMQFDMYHVYTIDEHLIRTVAVVGDIEQGRLDDEIPQLSAVCAKINSRTVLYVAALLHDIGKGGKGDHSIIGAEIAAELCPRLGLSPEESETVEWLVQQHLAMSRTAFKRDLDDVKTITDFIALVQSPERLRLLLCLTVADIRAVGPQVWNAWKGNLLWTLFRASEDRMLGLVRDNRRAERVAAVCQELRATLLAEGWDDGDVARHLDRGYPDYWLGFDADTLVHHAHLVHKAEQDHAGLMLDIQNNDERSASEITLYAPDHPGLFCSVAGAMALAGANIVDARANTLSNGMALDSFFVQNGNGEAFTQPARRKQLLRTVESVLAGRVLPSRELEAKRQSVFKRRTDLFTVPPRVLIDNDASVGYTLMEINGRDRLGLLYAIAAVMTRLSLQIASAHISTYGERVVDVFYIKDVFGLKITNERKLTQIREELLKVLDDGVAIPS